MRLLAANAVIFNPSCDPEKSPWKSDIILNFIFQLFKLALEEIYTSSVEDVLKFKAFLIIYELDKNTDCWLRPF